MYNKLIRELPRDYNLLVVDMQEEARCIVDPIDLSNKIGFIKSLLDVKREKGKVVFIEMIDEEAPIGPVFDELKSVAQNYPIFRKYALGAFNRRGEGKLDRYLEKGLHTVIVGHTAEQCVYETGLGAKKYGFMPIMAIEGIMKPKSEDTWKQYIEKELTVYVSKASRILDVFK